LPGRPIAAAKKLAGLLDQLPPRRRRGTASAGEETTPVQRHERPGLGRVLRVGQKE
jgi:hypothetical protein